MKRKMNREWLPHIIAVGAFVVFMVLGLASATTPTSQIEMGAEYQKYLQAPSGKERAIDTVGMRGSAAFVCRDPSHAVTPAQVLGATYQLGGEYVSKSKAAEAEAPTERHKHEVILDQLAALVKKEYPSEKGIDMRSARTAGHNPTNARSEEYSESVRNSDGSYSSVTRYRTVWDCYPVYRASVITTEDMPPNITPFKEEFALPRGSNQSDTYNKAYIWVTRYRGSEWEMVKEDESNNPQRYYLKGRVSWDMTVDHPYRITTVFTMDFFTSVVQINFEEPILQRTDASRSSFGAPEKIFLQSISDAVQKKLVSFSNSLKSGSTQ
jgi:hypothetical protein